MRVAFFCPTLSGTGGIESATRNLISGFEALGDQTHLFLFGGTYNAAWLEGLPHTTIGSPQDTRAARLASYALGAVRAVRGWRPDAIICSDATTIEMARLGRGCAFRRDILIASWIHFPLGEVRLKEKLRRADLHLAISGQIANDLQTYLPEQRDRVFTIFNAFPGGSHSLVPRPARPVFLYAGRLNFDDHKRVNDILVAVSRLRGEWRLKLIGAAPEGHPEHATRLRALAAELGIEDRLEWLGWQRDPWAAAGEATALVSSSAREGFPMVMVEAISHGVACVSSACTGPLEIIEPGRNGWLYPIADVAALAARLQAIVDDLAVLPPQDQIQKTALRFSAEAVARRARDGIVALQPAGGR